MTTQGAEVHINDAAYAPRGVGFMQPMRRDQRILQSQRDRHTLAVASSAQRHPVAADRHVSRPIHQEIQSPYPSVSAFHASPNLGCRPARNGQSVAGVIGSTLIARQFLSATATPKMGDSAQSCYSLFDLCSARNRNARGNPNSRGPTRANTPSEPIHPPGPPSDGVTPSQEAAHG